MYLENMSKENMKYNFTNTYLLILINLIIIIF